MTCLSSERVRDALFGAITAEVSVLYFKPQWYAKLLCAGQGSKVELPSLLSSVQRHKKVEV